MFSRHGANDFILLPAVLLITQVMKIINIDERTLESGLSFPPNTITGKSPLDRDRSHNGADCLCSRKALLLTFMLQLYTIKGTLTIHQDTVNNSKVQGRTIIGSN